MRLTLDKLEDVRHAGAGEYKARCPACAEDGGDRKAEHLRVFADGNFGCCANSKDKMHRQRIIELAGLQHAGLAIQPFPVAAGPTGRSIRTEVMRGYGTDGTPRTDPVQPTTDDTSMKTRSFEDMVSAVPAVPNEPVTQPNAA
jgi:hypothetical protein